MTNVEKIRMAIWMMHRLIDSYPTIYRYLKEQYEIESIPSNVDVSKSVATNKNRDKC